MTRVHIDALVAPTIEGRVFDMIAAMLKKDAESALCMLNDLFVLKTDPTQILAAIVYNAEKLLSVKLLAGSGADKSQIMSKLKISPFAASKFMKDSAKYSEKQLEGLVKRLAEVDASIKSHSMEKTILMDLLVAEIASTL